MNRDQRRSLQKSKSVGGEMKYLNSPCTLTEAAQIARGVAEDVVTDYQKHTSPLQVSMSLQIELIKDILFKNGIITEEEFHQMYIESAEEFQKTQEKYLAEKEEDPEENDGSLDEENSPKMAANVTNIEVVKQD